MGINVFQLAKTVSVKKIIGKYIPLKPKGKISLGLCPFHNDHHVGSFIVYDIGFRCYSCGASGDGIGFVSQFLGVTLLESAVLIALDENLISYEEAEYIRAGKKIYIEKTKQKIIPQFAGNLQNKQDIAHLNKVYHCFVSASLPLDEQAKNILINERKIPKNDLEKYFLYPQYSDKKRFYRSFWEEIDRVFGKRDWKEREEIVLGVPGFYLNQYGKISCTMAKNKSIGIIIRDRNGLISGIQLRNIEEGSTDNRYKFLSSGFADGSKDSHGSCGSVCGYVEDVLYPRNNDNHKIAVTEGRFKAEKLCQLGYTVVNLHGITNWDNAGNVAITLANQTNAERFVLCYDAENTPQVKNSAHNLYEKLRNTSEVNFAVWPPEYGKGIDDVINNGHMNTVRIVNPDEYFSNC